MMAWSMVSWTQAWMTDRASFYVTRALIGLFEGGFIPGTILFASYFYKTKELAVRLAFFWSTLNVSCHCSIDTYPEIYSDHRSSGGSYYFIATRSWNLGNARCQGQDWLVLVVFN
jgi:MFS family permease